MRIRDDGTIQSANTPTWMNAEGRKEDHALYRAMVIRVAYVDDNANVTKNAQNPEVTYDVIVLGGFAAGQIISNVRLSSFLGGTDNFYERTLTPCTKPLSDTRLSDQDGDIVYLQFIQGREGYPVIVALGKGINDISGTTKAEGPRELKQFNGLEEKIDKDGQYSITHNGVSGDGLITMLKMTKDQKILLTTTSGTQIMIDGSGEQITMTAGSTKVDMLKSGTITMTAGSTEVVIDGDSGKVTLKAEKVDLGASASDMVVLFNQLKTAFDAHTHMYDDAGSPSVTQPPLVPLPTSVGSQTVKVQP